MLFYNSVRIAVAEGVSLQSSSTSANSMVLPYAVAPGRYLALWRPLNAVPCWCGLCHRLSARAIRRSGRCNACIYLRPHEHAAIDSTVDR